MKTIVLASQKGGAGKTTLALHLAVAAETAGLGPVVLLDTDPQRTLTQWWHTRKADTPAMAAGDVATLRKTLAELAEQGFSLAIIDTPGRSNEAARSVIELADLVLMPVKPSAGDLWALTSTLEETRKLRKPFSFIVSQAVRGAAITVQTISLLSAEGAVAPVVIHNRVGYAAALGLGETIMEMEPKGPGAGEIGVLLDFVQSRILSFQQDGNPSIKQPIKRAARHV